ncbi:DUF4241 domain-containing protein [Micromonospora sp. C28SCA-DRY-2]|uniref:DUF4241 domain-containing protein n=1 Tax=Micromonospora sp. C28SCA-DRY-2 TaxID=3059522 RepID=UPI0026746977|nr:DUF4241 domain-containing protein [Micromonospora sp. C28SCA-DRY-2]MDO3702219.1 DUF4241 domain-containing protein [Micromonospora sp. C28SCA-DRY-2]
MTNTRNVVYADGWDGSVVNPLSRAEAEARDAAGTPYAVLVLADGRPEHVLAVSWGDGYCGTTRYDHRGRRVATDEWRRTPDGDLFLRCRRTWHGPDGVGEHEFPHVAARRRTTYRLDGRRHDIDEPQGDRGGRRDTSRVEAPPRTPRPAFGRWHALLGLDGGVRLVETAGHGLPVTSEDEPPWRPPRPMPPGDLENLFIDGSTRTVAGGAERARLQVRHVGDLRLPSGRLVAADPAWLEHAAVPYTVTVPPGSYPVTLSLARIGDDPRHVRVAAARLDVTDRPVRGWEMALRPGQDLLDLGHDEFFGFGVDAGMACFVDADEVAGRIDAWRTLGLGDEPYLRAGDGGTVLWLSGWGDGAYPTWVGRDAEGRVACFVADMLL